MMIDTKESMNTIAPAPLLDPFNSLAPSEMARLLVCMPDGRQTVISVGEGGSFHDPGMVLWDERTDGDFPAQVRVGGMKRVAHALAFDQALYDASQARDAEASKTAMWHKIKAERARRKGAGVKVGQFWFHSDDASRIEQIGLKLMGANMPELMQWKTMSGAFVNMTPALADQVFTFTLVQDQAIFAMAEQHRAAMEAAADPLAYDFGAGWPPVYGE